MRGHPTRLSGIIFQHLMSQEGRGPILNVPYVTGVGIQPTVPGSRTLEGIREGRDELLEKAIEVVGRP